MINCAVCGQSQMPVTLFQTPSIVDFKPFTVGQCPSCQARFVLNPPDDLGPYYAGTHMRKRQNPIYVALKNILLSMELARIARHVPADAVMVDIGCGAGEFSALMHQKGRRVIAVDATDARPPMIEAYPQVPFRSLDFATGIIKDLPPTSGAVAVLRHVLEHVGRPDIFLQKLVAQGNEYFYIVVPNHANAGDRVWKEFYYYYDVPRHLWFFEYPVMERLLTANGLEIKAHGFDTIPTLVPTLYRWLCLKKFPQWVCKAFDPQGIISAFSLPFDFLMPHNVMWLIAHKRKG